MSVKLIEQPRTIKTRPFASSSQVFNWSRQGKVKHRGPGHALIINPITESDDMAFLLKSVIPLVVLGITPLILFLILNYFYPNLFLIPVTPN
ncbi:MAG: hypothetical protein R3C02_19530 [Planctomycetaceae bacterium]